MIDFPLNFVSGKTKNFMALETDLAAKIADALKTIGINACKSFTGGSHNEWWEDISKDSVKCLIFSGTISIQCDNEKFAIKLAEKLRDMNKVYNENGFEDFIDRIFEENEREKEYQKNKESKQKKFQKRD